MKRNNALIIAGILLFSLIVQIGAAEAQPRFTIENSTQDIFEVDLAGNVLVNQTIYAQNITVPDNSIDEVDIAFVTPCASGNHYYLSGNDLACEADDVGIETLTLAGDTGSETLGEGDTITIIGGTGGIDVAVTATDTATITFDWTEVAANAIAEAKVSFDTSCGTGNHLYIDGSNDLACEADDDTTYNNASWDLGAITNAQCTDCITDANLVDDVTMHAGGMNLSGIDFVGTIGPGNFTPCGAGEIYKESGGSMVCAADDSGADGVGNVYEAVYPLGNNTADLWLNDIFTNSSGDTMTGNLIMDDANFTDANTNARIEFTSGGGVIIHLEA